MAVLKLNKVDFESFAITKKPISLFSQRSLFDLLNVLYLTSTGNVDMKSLKVYSMQLGLSVAS